jgi:PAS domain-containing protein/two-component sensor histidine kinase
LIEYNGRKALLGLVTDITERKRNEATLQQSEEQFRQLFSSMPSGVAIYEAVENGEDFVFRDFNSAAEKIEQISKTDIFGKRVTQVFPNIKSFGIFEVFQRVWRTGQPEYYPVALYKDDKGLSSWRENWVYRLPNGNVIAIYNDISERMKIDVALRQERDMLESVTAASGAGLAIVSKDYHVLWANDFIKRYKGDTVGKLCYATLNSLNAPCSDCGVVKIFAGKPRLDAHEYCSTTVDGTPYWVEIVATPLTDENGNITSAVEIAVDITERKKNEEKLRESIYNYELINQKLGVVGSLTRHDIGNKLMVMKANMYLLKKQIGDNPKLAMYLEGIDSAIDQSDKMFKFSRFYEKIGVEEPSEIDIAECFNQAVALVPSLGTIRIDNDCQGLEVMADSLLKQLFYNFLDNSLKHGEKVTQIRLHYTKEGDGLNLFYEDNGVGIPEANKPKLFHEGFSTGKSTGLGLFLIKKMVEVYGWTISEEGEPAKGAKFNITIPKLNKNGKENYQIT